MCASKAEFRINAVGFQKHYAAHPQTRYLRAAKAAIPKTTEDSLGGFDFQQTGIKWSPEIWERTLGMKGKFRGGQ